MSHKRPYARIKHEYNSDFDKLIHDMSKGRVNDKLSSFMTRPAYAHTSLEQKRIYRQNPCEGCGYYYQAEDMPKPDCTFPWFDPKDYDMAAYEFLPCVEENADEED